MNKQLLKASGADVLSSRRKLRKTLWAEVASPLPPTLVRLRVKIMTFSPALEMLGHYCMKYTLIKCCNMWKSKRFQIAHDIQYANYFTFASL